VRHHHPLRIHPMECPARHWGMPLLITWTPYQQRKTYWAERKTYWTTLTTLQMMSLSHAPSPCVPSLPVPCFQNLTALPHHDAWRHSVDHKISAWMHGWNNSKLRSLLLPAYLTASSTSWQGPMYVACLATALESVPWGIQYAASKPHSTNRIYPFPYPLPKPLVPVLPTVELTYA
jgi:hypothetical protein